MKLKLNTVTKEVVVLEVEKEIVLTLTEKEASHLCSVVGAIVGGNTSDPNSIRHTTSKIFIELDKLNVEDNWDDCIDTNLVLKKGA